jgi:hypothetical protein
MRYNCLLVTLFFCTQSFAHGLHGKACFSLFNKIALISSDGPQTLLASLGLKEGVDFSGAKNKSIVVVEREASDISILLDRFQERWPGIELFYSTEKIHSEAIRALMRMGKHVTFVHIPLDFLTNYWRLEQHIVELNNNLKKIEKLLREPVDFIVTKMTSQGFALEIEGFRNRPADTYLAWMWRRQQRHQFNFTFTNHLFDPILSRNALGKSVGRRIFMADFLLFSEDKNFAAFLAHEIVHSTNQSQFEKHGDATGKIEFYAGESNELGLFGEADIPNGYKRAFSTDEVEAWLVTEKFHPEVSHSSGVTYKDFLYNQIEWLTELRRVLPGQLVENESSWVGWVREVTEKTVFAAAPWVAKEENPFYQFVIFRGAPNEVVIKIPRVQNKVAELESLDFLLETIDKRLHQLNNRARLVSSH